MIKDYKISLFNNQKILQLKLSIIASNVFRGLNNEYYSSIFYWFLDLHIFFQIVIGIVLLAVVYGILDEVFGLSSQGSD